MYGSAFVRLCCRLSQENKIAHSDYILRYRHLKVRQAEFSPALQCVVQGKDLSPF